MKKQQTEPKIAIVVYAEGHPLAGHEVPLEDGCSFKGVDWLRFKAFEAEVVAEEGARSPSVYDQNLADALKRRLRDLERAAAAAVTV